VIWMEDQHRLVGTEGDSGDDAIINQLEWFPESVRRS
jgi:hypothetical protein